MKTYENYYSKLIEEAEKEVYGVLRAVLGSIFLSELYYSSKKTEYLSGEIVVVLEAVKLMNLYGDEISKNLFGERNQMEKAFSKFLPSLIKDLNASDLGFKLSTTTSKSSDTLYLHFTLNEGFWED